MSPKCFTVATKALLFLHLRSSHMQLCMSDSFTQHISNIHRSVIVLFRCYIAGATMNLQPSWHRFHGHDATMHHAFADDNHSTSTLDAIHQSIETLQNCTTDVKSWMTANKLQLNDNKTEAMIVLSNRMSVHSHLSFTSEMPMSHLCHLLKTSV